MPPKVDTVRDPDSTLLWTGQSNPRPEEGETWELTPAAVKTLLRSKNLEIMNHIRHAKDTPVKDLRDDGGELFSRIFNSRDELPEILRKKAHLVDPVEISRRPSLSFADPDSRQFLIDTPEHVMTSLAYLSAQGIAEGDFRIGRVKEAAALFGIESHILDLERMITRRLNPPAEKTASPIRWTVNVEAKVGDERKEASVSGVGELDLIDAANHVRSIGFARDNPPEVVSSFAEGILKVASKREWGLGSPGDVSDLMLIAGRACPDRELSEAAIFSRASFFPDRFKNSISSAARKLASLDKFPDRDSLLKIAFHIGKIDRELGLEKFYGIKIPDPMRSVFHHSESFATKMASVFRVGAGTEYLQHQVEQPQFREAAMKIADLNGVERSSVPEEATLIPSWIPTALEVPFRKIASDLGLDPRRVL